MTRVDFYLLDGESGENRQHFACRLADKAYRQGRRIYIHAGSQAEVQMLDQLLWTFREQSFLPHGVAGQADPHVTPVLLGQEQAPEREDDVLINLAPQVPSFFSRFQRVAEIIDGHPQTRSAGRERYRFYRDRGYPLETHEPTP